ncbi:hypothetical protein LCGC14_1328100, partial [marine sediment metagenome]
PETFLNELEKPGKDIKLKPDEKPKIEEKEKKEIRAKNIETLSEINKVLTHYFLITICSNERFYCGKWTTQLKTNPLNNRCVNHGT